MESKRRYYSANMFRVCIDSYQNDIEGRIYSPMCREVIPFAGSGEMLLKMDRLFDRMGYPQAFQNKRSFDKDVDAGNSYRGVPKAVQEIETILQQTGEYCTYDIVVESRRNTSWQGYIYDPDGEEQGRFSGEVELLALLTELTEERENV